MTTPAPLLLPDTAEGWTELLTSTTERTTRTVEDAVEALTTGTAPDPLGAWDEIDLALSDGMSLVALAANVHPDGQVRDAAEEHERALHQLATEVGLDRGLYEALTRIDPAPLDGDRRRLLERVLRDFRRSGVALDDTGRARVRELREQATALGQDFGRRIREDVRRIQVPASALDGLPDDFVAAHPADDAGLVTLTTEYPDVIPFRVFSTDPDARRTLITQFLDRGWPDNDAVLRELLEVRAELAGLLGYSSWAAYDAEVKMVGSAEAIADFVDRVAVLAEPAALRDREILQADKDAEDDTHGRRRAPLDASCTEYHAERIRRERFAVDAQQVRRYFDFSGVRDGLLAVTGRLFGISYRPVDVPVWHEDVTAYDVLAGEATIGRIYLDLHPRAGKFSHAAQFSLTTGIEGRHLPEGALVCNFPRGLMVHSDVVTLFHEFGHLVHHVLGGHQRLARFSGVATEWDFVEAPSQLLEEWAWDARVLQEFARDADGTPIPTGLVESMRAARSFGEGYRTRTQLWYAAVSYHLHLDPPRDLTAAVRELQARYDVFTPLPDTHFHASFGHLEGYASAYYTYQWSLVIATDLFSAFDHGDLLATGPAHRYRDRILVPGGSKDAADLVADFLGRPYSFDAYAARLSGG